MTDEGEWKHNPRLTKSPHVWRTASHSGIAHLVGVDVLKLWAAGKMGPAQLLARCGQHLNGGVHTGRAAYACGKCEKLATHPTVEVTDWSEDDA